MNIPSRDVPFSISTYTGSFIHSIEALRVDKLYSYMTGIQSAGTTGYDMVFRGFQSGGSDINSILIDGLPGLSTRFGSPPTIGISRIDVVRGPASVLNGQEQPGGFINLITKKPQGEPLYELSAKATTYDGAGVGLTDRHGMDYSADLTGPIDSHKRFLYRLVLDDSNRDTYRYKSYNHSVYFAPSVTWNISDADSLTAAYVYERLRYSYDTYLVAPDNNINLVAPITTRYQEPGDHAMEHGSVLTLSFSHEFDNGWSWDVKTRDVWHTDYSHGHDPVKVLPDLQDLARRAKIQLNKRDYNTLDTTLHMPFDTYGIAHNMVAGITAAKDSINFDRLQHYNAPTTGPGNLNINIYHPIYGTSPPLSQLPLYAVNNPNILNDRYSEQHIYAGYFADMVTLSASWKATVGLRYTTIKELSKFIRPKNLPQASKTNSDLLPMIGLVYQPSEHWSYYVSYSTSFIPPAPDYVDINGVNSFVPTSAKQIEIGTKANYLNGRLSVTMAAYKIHEKNTFSHFNCSFGTCYTQVGKARSQGAEFEINARPVTNWQLTAGYAYTDAKITASDNPVQVGTRLPNVPYNSAHIWSRYDFRTPALVGLGFGIGVIHDGLRYGITPTKANTPMLKLPAYNRVDAALYYDFNQVDLAFKVENLFDKTYYQSAGSRGADSILPGTPRMFTLSLTAYFQ